MEVRPPLTSGFSGTVKLYRHQTADLHVLLANGYTIVEQKDEASA